MIINEENTNHTLKAFHLPGVRLLLCVFVVVPLAYFLNLDETTVFVTLLSGLLAGILTARFIGYVPAFLILSATLGIYIGTNARRHQIIIPEKKIMPIQAGFIGEVESIVKRDSNSLRILCVGKFDAEPLPPLSKVRIIASLKQSNNRLQGIRPGSVIRLYGLAKFPQKPTLPTDFDEETYCQGLDVQIIMSSYEDNTYIVKQNYGWRTELYKISEHIIERIYTIFPSETGGLMAALLIGDKSKLTLETKTNYSLAGASHVLAVSGLHIGIIAMMILIPLSFISNKKIKLIMFVVLVIIFTLVTGVQPSAIRASLMSILIMTAYTFQRKPQLLNIVCITAVIIVLFDPSFIFSVGFQLSFFAVLGIAIFYQPIVKKIFSALHQDYRNFLVKFLVESIAVSISATSLVAPFVAWYFDVFSLIGVFVNIIAVPLTSAAMIFGFIALMTSYISMAFADFYAVLASYLIQLSDDFTQSAAVWSFSAIQGNNSLTASLLTTLVMLYVIFSHNMRMFFFRIVTCSVICCCIVVLTANNQKKQVWEVIPRNDMVMTVLPVNSMQKFILLEDRKPHLNPRNDNALIDFLIHNNSDLIIGKRGNCSEWITVKVAEKRKVQIFSVPDSLYYHIQERIGITQTYSVIETKQGEI